MNIKTSETNPNGTGQEVEAPIVLIDKINADLEKLLKGPAKDDGITLNIHPFIAAYLSKGFPSIRAKWFLEHKKWVKIQPRDAYTYLEYRFKNKDGKTIY
jgi:ribonuclease G